MEIHVVENKIAVIVNLLKQTLRVSYDQHECMISSTEQQQVKKSFDKAITHLEIMNNLYKLQLKKETPKLESYGGRFTNQSHHDL